MESKLIKLGVTPKVGQPATADQILNVPSVFASTSKKKDQATQLHNYICTIYPDNFPNVAELDRTLALIGADSSFALFGLELAPTTGRAHLHGVIVFNERVRITALKKQFPPCIHWEPMKGTPQQAIDYIEDKEPIIFGELPVDPGEREKNRWKLAREQLSTGDVDRLQDDQIYVQHFNSCERIADRFAAKEAAQDLEEMPQVYYLYGVPGAGKSMFARTDAAPHGPLYLKEINNWWCGYDPKVHTGGVLIDDLGNGDRWIADRLKQWTDRYAFPASRKNRPAVNIRPKRIYITSNYSLEQLFNLYPQDVAALDRRCTTMYFPTIYSGRGKPIFHEVPKVHFDSAALRHLLRATLPGTVGTFNNPVVLPDDDEEEDSDFGGDSKYRQVKAQGSTLKEFIPAKRTPLVSSSSQDTVELNPPATQEDLEEPSSEVETVEASPERVVTPVPKLKREATWAPEQKKKKKKKFQTIH